MPPPQTTTSKFGGTRIPFNKLERLPPKVKFNELISIHRDGSVRYFANEKHDEVLKNDDVLAVVYNGTSGPRLPQVIVREGFVFTQSVFQKPVISLRGVIARYVDRSHFTASIFRSSDASLKPVGYYKTIWATELGLRAAL